MTIYEQALCKWGIDAQMEQLIEECAEVILAIRHMRRGKCGARELIEEMVDVEIMIEQMKHIFPLDVWNEIKDKKLDRLSDTIKNSEV